MVMQELPLDGIERILVVAAHPDDVDFGIAASVATWTDGGIEVVYAIVTDGDAGGAELGIPRSEMGPLRRDEQRAAAAVVGVDDVRFLNYPDARNRWAHTELLDEGLEPHSVDEVWLTSAAPDPTHYTDVTDAVDRKIRALLSHKSQMNDPVATETMVRSWLAASGQVAGLPEGRYAEIVRVVNTR